MPGTEHKASNCLVAIRVKTAFPSCPAVLTLDLFTYSMFFNLFFPPEICFSALSQELRNSDKAIAHLENPPWGSSDHCLHSALSNGLFPYLIWQVPTGRLQCKMSYLNLADGHGRAGIRQNLSFKCYSTEDNLSSLNYMTKQFSQSDGTATVSFVVPASWLIPALTLFLSSHLPLPNPLLQPEHVSIYILGVQFNDNLSSVKTFSNLYNI